ncbi:MAG: DUF4404 family protein [Steroidobacteraceae bacterium]
MSHPIDQQLHDLHEKLTSLPQVEPATREQLLIVLADINRLLDSEIPQRNSPAEAVESLAAQFDVDHPSLSAALRNLVDTLGKAGI